MTSAIAAAPDEREAERGERRASGPAASCWRMSVERQRDADERDAPDA